MIKIDTSKKPEKGFDRLLVSASSLNVGEVFAFGDSVENVVNGEPVLQDSCSYYMAITLHSDTDIICIRITNTDKIDKDLDHPDDVDELIDQAMFTYIGRDEKVLPVELTVTKIEASV